MDSIGCSQILDHDYSQAVGGEIIAEDSLSCIEKKEKKTLTDADLSSHEEQDFNDEIDGGWSPEDVFCLIDYYEENKEAFSVESHKPLWGKLAATLGRSREQCAIKFRNLKHSYLQNLEKMANGKGVKWPYFHRFEAIFRDNSELHPGVETKPSKPVHPWSRGKTTKLISLYKKNLENFKTQTNKYIWKEIAHILDRDVDECSSKFRNLKHTYLLNLKRMKSGRHVSWPYFKLMLGIFEKNADKKKEYASSSVYGALMSNQRGVDVGLNNLPPTLTDILPAKSTAEPHWSHEEVLSLISFYKDNKELFKLGKPGVLWRPLGKRLGREADECSLKFRNMKQTYIANLENAIAGKQVKWHYFDQMHDIFNGGTRWAGERVEVNTHMLNPPTEPWTHDETLHLLSFYEENKEAFKVQLPSKLWPPLALSLGRYTEDCAIKFQNMKQTYRNNLEKKKAGEIIKWSYFDRFHEIFEGKPPIRQWKNVEALSSTVVNKEPKESSERSLPLKVGQVDEDREPGEYCNFTHEETLVLISCYEDNLQEIAKEGKEKSVWINIGKKLGRQWHDCASMFSALEKQYFTIVNSASDGDIVKWPYFGKLHTIFQKTISPKLVSTTERRSPLKSKSDIKELSVNPNLKRRNTIRSGDVEEIHRINEKPRKLKKIDLFGAQRQCDETDKLEKHNEKMTLHKEFISLLQGYLNKLK